MIFSRTSVAGVYVVRPETLEDERGYFARVWCGEEFAAQGLNPTLSQCSVSFNHKRGTLRGLHYQAAPHGEAKLVRCTRGRIFDVAVDLRKESETYLKYFGMELDSDDGDMLYIPEGCAHGFLTLHDNTDVTYWISYPYTPGASRGARWNDPAFGINWPHKVHVINERDRTYPDFEG